MKKAVVLLSGGLDSTTCLALAKSKGFDCHAISFNYDQRHKTELKAAKHIAEFFKVKEHRIINLDLSQFGGSALTDTSFDVPDYDEQLPENFVPITYVPARNTIFLSMALAYAEVIGANHLFIGVSSIDYSNYPDCRSEYIDAFEKMANLATRAGIEGSKLQIHTPLIELSKAQTIQAGIECGVDYAMTVSCYQLTAQGLACGRCDSCYLRKRGFEQANIADPTLYV